MITPVIMCGGSGTRLWPASRDDMPKQFMTLFGAHSTFQDTLTRLDQPELFEKPIVITNERFRFVVAEQAQALGIDCKIILEPIARDSAAAVAVAALHTNNCAPDSVVLVLAADHAVTDVGAFHNTCRDAMAVARKGHIVAFGIYPTHPATGYGYLQPGDAIAGTDALTLAAFIEKPDITTAKKYLANGFLWNSGNLMFEAKTMLDEIKTHAIEVGAAAEAAIDNCVQDADFLRLSEPDLAKSPKISIDYAVMEKSSRGAVMPSSFGWSDVGNWDAVWTISDKDKNGNAISGKAVCLNAKDCLVHSADDIETVVSGVDNLVVVTTAGAVLVTTREKSEDLKQILDVLKAGKKT